MSLRASQNSTRQTPQFHRDIQHKEQLMVSINVNYSQRVTHGAHTLTFTPWDKCNPRIHINKNHSSSITHKITKSKHPWIQLDYKAHDHIKITSWERKMNHIATIDPSTSRENYSRMVMVMRSLMERLMKR